MDTRMQLSRYNLTLHLVSLARLPQLRHYLFIRDLIFSPQTKIMGQISVKSHFRNAVCWTKHADELANKSMAMSMDLEWCSDNFGNWCGKDLLIFSDGAFEAKANQPPQLRSSLKGQTLN